MDKQMLIRSTCLLIALVNQVLVATGVFNQIIDDATVYEYVSTFITAILAVINWWKNNNITVEAKSAQAYLDDLKSNQEDNLCTSANGEEVQND